MADKSNLVEKIKKWLKTEGYPLEFQCADICKKAGLNVRVGVSLAREGEKPRDIDVLAGCSPDGAGGHRLIIAQIAAECKYAKDGQPWVVLCQDEIGFAADWTVKATLSQDAFMGFWTVPLSNQQNVDWEKMRSIFLVATDTVGTSVIQPMIEKKGNSGIPFNAIQKAVDSALACVETASYVSKRIESIKPDVFIPSLAFALPCVIIKGPIVAANYNASTGEMECKEVRSARINTQSDKAVYLLNTDSFPEFVERATLSLRGFCDEAMKINLQSLRIVRDTLRS